MLPELELKRYFKVWFLELSFSDGKELKLMFCPSLLSMMKLSTLFYIVEKSKKLNP